MKEDEAMTENSMSQDAAQEDGNGSFDPRLVLLVHKNTSHAEQYREVRTNILSLDRGRPPRCLAITSSINGEGKSITTLNLAMSFAEDHTSRILVIDGDLRKPTLNKLFKKERAPGLSDILQGSSGIESALQSTEVPNLHFISAGKAVANPAKILGSDRMTTLAEILKEDFNFIFIDCPPVTGLTDAMTLGKVVDGVVLVIKMGVVGKKLVTNGLESLQNANVAVVGTILTNVVRPQSYYSKYYLHTGESK